MVDHDELLDLDYSAYDHVVDFREALEDNRMRVNNTEVSLGFHYDDDTPVLDVHASDGRKEYVDSYRLEGVSPDTFEGAAYELWVSAFEEDFEVSGVLNQLDNGEFREE